MTITFDRVSDEALRRIARRVLREEDIDYTNDAIDVLVDGNHGDLRALVRDHRFCRPVVWKSSIQNWFENTSKQESNMTTEVFPGMESLYRSRQRMML